MEQKPSNHDEEAWPPERPPFRDSGVGEGEPPDEDDIEPAVPPAFDPATRRRKGTP
ncbi:MAG TPA: hypothetical protein VGG41_14900 [Solirubrobacteraceae bacterium]|jgi:hypothetical protein